MIRKVFLRSPFNYDMNVAGDEDAVECRDPSLAHQSFKEECDINTIIDRFGVGMPAPSGLEAPTYGDFTDIVDFHTAANAIAKARESFDAMPASVRERFNNEPGAFVAFCSREENRAEAEKLGLVVPRCGAVQGAGTSSQGAALTSSGSSGTVAT